MDKHRKVNRAHSVFALCAGIFVLALLAPVAANAQVTVFHVRVTVSGAGSTATYCDFGTSCPNGIQVWQLGTGISLAGGDTLVLTQTGGIPFGTPPETAGNFDTSDRFRPVSPQTFNCNTSVTPTSDPCTVMIELDTGSGLSTVYTDSIGDPIDNFNHDIGGNHMEQAPWSSPVFSAANYTLQLGYPDNAHGCTSNCFPNPFDGSGGTTSATRFIGAGTPMNGLCTVGNCYDGGALLITGVTVVTNFVTVTQGGWGAPPHGNNPGAILAANFGTVFPSGVTIGCSGGFTLKFTSADAIQNFLPQGGKPGALTASDTNPTARTDAGVFAGQVLALELNVSFSGPVFPGGLGNFHLTSGPLAGFTVNQVLTLANNVLGGCISESSLQSTLGISISDLNGVVDGINGLFDH
jgi:hypothetical protein